MSGSSGLRNLFKNPLVFGAAAGILVILFNILIASLAEGSLKEGFSVFLTEYKDAIIIIGLLANLAGSAYIARAIMKDRAIIEKGKSCCADSE